MGVEPDLLSQTTRHVPRFVASIVGAFEMLSRDVVSTRDVAEALGVSTTSSRVADAVRTLVELGWLRPLPARGTYEFMSARGGPYPGGDPLLDIRAVLAKRPDFRVAVIGTGAAFLRGYAERAPHTYAVAVDKEQGGSVALGRAYELVKTRSSRIARIPVREGVPVSDAAHLLADAALWPQVCGDLRERSHWLQSALAATSPEAAAAVAAQVGSAAAARMAYLAARFDAPDIAAAVATTLPHRLKTVIGAASSPIVARDSSLGVDDHLGVATLG